MSGNKAKKVVSEPEANRNQFPIMKTETQKIQDIIRNVVKMMSRRIYIDKQDVKHALVADVATTINDAERRDGDTTIIFQTDDGKKCALKIIFQRLTSITNQPVLNDFLTEFVQNTYRKIVVATAFNNKVAEYIIKNRGQIFEEAHMLQDLAAHEYQPKMEVLSPTETAQLKTEYNVEDYTITKITRNDIMTKYFGLKKGDALRIIRYSSTSGYSVGYRVFA